MSSSFQGKRKQKKLQIGTRIHMHKRRPFVLTCSLSSTARSLRNCFLCSYTCALVSKNFVFIFRVFIQKIIIIPLINYILIVWKVIIALCCMLYHQFYVFLCKNLCFFFKFVCALAMLSVFFFLIIVVCMCACHVLCACISFQLFHFFSRVWRIELFCWIIYHHLQYNLRIILHTKYFIVFLFGKSFNNKF